jgi:DNA-binding transcriptional ArsR family regulator
VPDHLSATFAALSDPTRRAILARLVLGETSVKELSEPFSLSAPSITKHLKVLERAGLIRRYRSFWEHSLTRLDDYLARLEAKETKKHARKRQR